MVKESESNATIPRVGRLETASDVLGEMRRVYRAGRRGDIEIGEMKAFAYVLNTMATLIRDTDLEKRIEALEGGYMRAA